MGAIKAEGIKNQLGRPTVDRLTVLVREAAQNSWDASDHLGPVHFGLELRKLPDDVAKEWRRVLSVDAPSAEDLPLRPTLERPELSVLFVSDRGTTGLGGPTRADEVVAGKTKDYVSFVLNVGDPRDAAYGGGTYGFGKAVFFRASGASTIVVHTHCRNESDVIEARLVGCALGGSYEADGRAHTGRHWFGIPEGPGVIEPVRGEDADAIADLLGFPRLAPGELGLTIAVLAPKLDDHAESEAVQLLADSVTWHLWPKMLARQRGEPAMTFSVAHDGEPVELIDPREHPVLREFVSALEELDGSGEKITYGSAAVPIGRIRLRTTFAPPPVVDEVGRAAGLGNGVRHCCLLRIPELVVEYRQGPPLPDERIWYAGVFKTEPELDETFAKAEPPTHDAWSPEELDDRERSIVRTTLRKIDDALRTHTSPVSRDDAGRGDADGLAAVSRFLGSLLAPAPAQAAGPRDTNGSGRSTSKSRVKMIGSPRWDRHEGMDVVVQEFEVEPGRSPLTVEAEASVRVWGGGGRESAPPLGAPAPALIAWRAPGGKLHPGGRLAVQSGESGRWEAIVSVPRDTMTRIRIHEARADGRDG
jgi:hypothetical protein